MSQRIRSRSAYGLHASKRRADSDRDFMLLAFGLTYSLTILVGLVMAEVWRRC